MRHPLLNQMLQTDTGGFYKNSQALDPEFIKRREEQEQIFGGGPPPAQMPTPSTYGGAGTGPGMTEHLENLGNQMDQRIARQPTGTAEQVVNPAPAKESGGFFSGMNKKMQDPARRAMLAFGAAMMDTSSPKWQQLEFGTQLSRALNAGLGEYAKATKAGKPPTIIERKFDKDGKRMGEQGYMHPRSGDFHAIGSPYLRDKPDATKEPKAYKPGDYIKDPKTGKYKQFPKDEDGAKRTAPSEKDYTPESWKKYITGKNDTDLVLKKDTPPTYKKGYIQSYQKGEETKYREWDGKKFVPFSDAPRWDPASRGGSGTKRYTMPGGEGLTISEIIKLYKAQNPKEAGGIAQFAAIIANPDQADAWLQGQDNTGHFGKWLDKIGFKDGLNYLKGRTPVGAGGEPALEYKPGAQLEHGKYYNTKKGVMKYSGNDDTFYPKKDWGNEKLWSQR